MRSQLAVTRLQGFPAIARIAGPALWAVFFVLAVAWRAQNLAAFGLVNDEGAHLMWARLAAVDGYPLYSQTAAVQWPLFLEMVGLALRLAGPTVQAGRWMMLLSGFGLLAAALSWLAYRAGRWPGALAVLVMAGLSPLLFTFSRLVMAEVLVTGLAVASVALALIYRETGQRRWLLISGLLLGLSLITKTLAPFIVGPVGLLLWRRQRGRENWLRAMAGDLAWWGLGVGLPLLAILLLYEPAALYYHLVAFRGELRAAMPDSAAAKLALFTTFITTSWGFWLLAAGGTATAWRDAPDHLRREDVLVWLAWLLAGGLMLAWHSPLYPHHFVVLLPPLFLLGANVVTALVRGPVGSRWSLACLALLLAAAFNVPAMVQANQQNAAIVTGGRETEALALLRAVSNPEDFLLGDSQLLIFLAGRRTPPPMGDVALAAIKAGRQTSSRMTELTYAYQAPAVVEWSLRLPWLPDYLAWVEANYLARRVWDNDHIIYYGQRWPAGRPLPHEQYTCLGEAVILRGYQVDTSPARPGQDLNLKLYWQLSAPLDQDYTVFTQLLDGQGRLVAGWDSQPLGGYWPTGRWPAGEIVTDPVHLPIPAEVPAGEYTLVTGMYLLATLERLPVKDNPANYVTLGTITIYPDGYTDR